MAWQRDWNKARGAKTAAAEKPGKPERPLRLFDAAKRLSWHRHFRRGVLFCFWVAHTLQ